MVYSRKLRNIAAVALAMNAAMVNADSDFDAIIGGTNVPSGNYAFLTSLQTTSGSHFCGGSLIAPNVVLTAAHCVANGSTNFRVFLDAVDLRDSSGKRATPKKVYVHESYNPNTIRNDIAIIELTSSVSGVTPITVDKTTTNDFLNSNTPQYTIAGWGRTSGGGSSPRIMQEVTLPVVPDNVCDNSAPFNTGLHDPSMVCIGLVDGSKSACNGDSGGPMFMNNVQIGLTSWGARGCTSHAVYTQLPYFADWIDEKLAAIGGTTNAPTKAPTEPNQTAPPTPASNECVCIGSAGDDNLDVGETCGNWLWAGFNWCYSDVECPGSTPSQRYPGYYWFRCTRSRLDQMIDYEMMANNFPQSTVAGYEQFTAASQQNVNTPAETPASSGELGLLGGLGIGVAGTALVSIGLFTYYKKQRDASIDAAIDRVEAERRVVSAPYEKSDV